MMELGISTGYGSLIIALVVCSYSAGAAMYGVKRNSFAWAESARLALMVCFPLVSFAVFSLLILLGSANYQVAYVYQVISSDMPLFLRLTALWGGQAGSLLFWTWLLAVIGFFALRRKWDSNQPLMPWITFIFALTLLFFLGLVLFSQNPFGRFWFLPGGGEALSVFSPPGAFTLIPEDGVGLNPLLRHPMMVLHPPFLYLGFVIFLVPFAYAVATLIARPESSEWLQQTRRWTLAGWIFLTLGLVLGSRWAYEVMGWGGYWGWDPVEIAAFMPWLTATAFLHSVVIEEKRAQFRRWNIILILLTFGLVILGIFITRSGIISSVHAFSESTVGPFYFGFISLAMLGSLTLLFWRWHDLRSESQLGSLFSREALFLFNNLLFMGILIVCFWGVLFPLVSEALTGQQITVGPPFYEKATAPLFIGLFLLMGVVPLSAWGQTNLKRWGAAIWKPALISIIAPILGILSGISNMIVLAILWLLALVTLITLYDVWRGLYRRRMRTGENWWRAFWNLAGQNRRRYGGYTVHLGIVLIGLGIIGIEVFQTQTQVSLDPGERLQMDGYNLTYQNMDIFNTADGRNVTRIELALSRENQILDILHPRQEYYPVMRQRVTLPAIYSTLGDDLYVLLLEHQGDQVTLKIFHNPLVNWLWIGAMILILGTTVAIWPEKRRET